ncbi:hypothetical protein SLEP1_g37204 [Rubroshorea leprosula]|uniref:Biogenesis of lysosome-related organelles complex 1 subunit 7 n=1 Tax=Rubroshorea leprosula TaxID=152421 RepID=A0AAV5KTY6_9ROSI|nr:hypothetical protein SLEP1_g37204 [Rubroshorea leprosula]
MENNPFTEVDATTSDVSTEANPSVSSNSAESHLNHLNNGSTEAVAKALSSMLTSLIQDFDSKAQNALDSQDQLNSALDRLTRELDQLLEDAPLPFIIQHASKISGVRKRVSSLNSVLKSIQWRVDSIDRILQTGMLHEKTAREHSS